jgi:hypothetical protein
MLAQHDFYGRDDAPLQQGDLVLAPVARLETGSLPLPEKWTTLDQIAVELRPDGDLPAFTVVGGYTLAMITAHDCQLDKEFAARVRSLRGDGQMSMAAAEAEAELDPQLDQFLNISPLVPLDSVKADLATVRANATIGLFHVHPFPEREIDEQVVDLTHTTTIDRGTIVRRLAVLTDHARSQLRFGLARLDAFRTPTIGFELEEAVGRRIVQVRQHPDNPLIVVLELAGGQELELVQQPAPVKERAPARRTAGVRADT